MKKLFRFVQNILYPPLPTFLFEGYFLILKKKNQLLFLFLFFTFYPFLFLLISYIFSLCLLFLFFFLLSYMLVCPIVLFFSSYPLSGCYNLLSYWFFACYFPICCNLHLFPVSLAFLQSDFSLHGGSKSFFAPDRGRPYSSETRCTNF